MRVAVAANAQFVIDPLKADFEQRSGIAIETIVGSSGRLAAQIMNGAPYDIFLSADLDYPSRIAEGGYALSRIKTYAYGKLIVASSTLKDVSNWQRLLEGSRIRKLAIAKPTLAPYGLAAQQALLHYALWDKVSAYMVYGESISQVNTYITSGSVDLGFTTESFIYAQDQHSGIAWMRIDETAYSPIAQGVVVCKYAQRHRHRAMAFFDYLSSPSAKSIIATHGYRVD